jgi:hypothetical protein
MTATSGAALPQLVLRRFLRAPHAVPVAKFAPPAAMVTGISVSAREPFVPPIDAWPHERFAEEPGLPSDLSIEALLAQTSWRPAITWFDSNSMY